MKDTRKRVSLYFNMDDEEEKALFEFLDTKKKNKYLKRLIENDMNSNPSTTNVVVPEPPAHDDKSKDLDSDLDLGEIDFGMDGMSF